jgi:hypothetical protein
MSPRQHHCRELHNSERPTQAISARGAARGIINIIHVSPIAGVMDPIDLITMTGRFITRRRRSCRSTSATASGRGGEPDFDRGKISNGASGCTLLLLVTRALRRDFCYIGTALI